MNKDWSEINKTMQMQLKKSGTFKQGIATLFELRGHLMESLSSLRNELTPEDFYAMPFKNAAGNHSTSISWMLWHVFRIEDVVCNTLVCNSEQVLLSGGYQKRICSPIITTANELDKQQIADFSKQLNIDELYSYAFEVKENSEKILGALSFDDIIAKVPPERRARLESLNVVSPHEDSAWLIDYWCNKDIRGLIQMPFSRHWIMHIEACLKIRDKLKK